MSVIESQSVVGDDKTYDKKEMKIKHQDLNRAIEKIATDPDQQKMFKMTEEEIRAWLNQVEVTDTGFDISPNFQSPGWGENVDPNPDINISDLGQNEHVLKHELRHALHFFSCVRLFSDERYLVKATKQFSDLLSDKPFLEWIEEYANEYGKRNIAQMTNLIMNNPDRESIKKVALVLGAIVYQHAYFVDASICEAIASFEDSGAFLNFNHFLNRNVGLMLPGKQPLEGYKNKALQNDIKNADPVKMAMILPKDEYEQRGLNYWLYSV